MEKRKINLIQFLPYFPPHKGGIEGFSEWVALGYATAWYGKVLNVTFSVGQPISCGKYERDGLSILVLPAFEPVKNFPIPKVWRWDFWKAFRSVPFGEYEIIQTHTRFFLSSFMGGIVAKIYGTQWIHFEHGSGYVVSNSTLVSFCSKLFDRTIGKWILRSANQVIGISEACKNFVHEEFTSREVSVIYSGLSIVETPKTISTDGRVRLTYVGRLTYLKGVQCLFEALGMLRAEWIDNFICRIVGDGEMRDELQANVKTLGLLGHVEFLGFRDRKEVLERIFPDTDIFVNPSFQEGLPTTVIEALLSKCTVVATNAGGTSEISSEADLRLVSPWDMEALKMAIRQALLDFQETQGRSHAAVTQKFDPIQNMEKIYRVYADALVEKSWK